MSEIGAHYAEGGVHLGSRERIYGHHDTLGFDRSHELIRFVIRPISAGRFRNRCDGVLLLSIGISARNRYARLSHRTPLVSKSCRGLDCAAGAGVAWARGGGQ